MYKTRGLEAQSFGYTGPTREGTAVTAADAASDTPCVFYDSLQNQCAILFSYYGTLVIDMCLGMHQLIKERLWLS